MADVQILGPGCPALPSDRCPALTLSENASQPGPGIRWGATGGFNPVLNLTGELIEVFCFYGSQNLFFYLGQVVFLNGLIPTPIQELSTKISVDDGATDQVLKCDMLHGVDVSRL